MGSEVRNQMLKWWLFFFSCQKNFSAKVFMQFDKNNPMNMFSENLKYKPSKTSILSTFALGI